MNNPKPPTELKRLFGQTWNPEIIISTFGVIAIIQSLPYIKNFLDQMFSDFGLFGESFFIKNGLIIPFYIILLFFTAHIALRTYWLGIIGLHYAFPKLNTDELDGKFQSKALDLRNFNASDEKIFFTTKLDKTCSSVFSWTFVVIFTILGITSLLIIFWLMRYFITSFVIRFLICGFFWFLYVLPQQSASIFRHIFSIILFTSSDNNRDRLKKEIEKVSEKISKLFVSLFEVMTLQFLYRSLKSRVIRIIGEFHFKSLIAYMTMFMLINMLIMTLLFSNSDKNSEFRNKLISSHNYENLRNQNFQYSSISINSDIVDDLLKIKVPFKAIMPITNLSWSKEKKTKLYNSYISQIQLHINDSILTNPKVLLTDEPTLFSTSYIIYYVDVQNLPSGLNSLKVTYPSSFNSRVEIGDTTLRRSKTIPFWVR